MISEDIKDLIGKNVKIVLSEGERMSVYTGTILDVLENFVVMHDKYDNKIRLAISRITRIEENPE